MNRNGIFIAGTDTGVGKTAVCAAVVCLLRKAGLDAVPMKAVQTGALRRDGELFAPDLELCLSLARLRPEPEEKKLMAPYLFARPYSPHLAAAEEGREIKMSLIMEAFDKLALSHQAVIVEGSGGLLVPISARESMLDLMAALSLPVILVSRPGLGTINHTLLSLRELARAGLTVLGVIFVETSRLLRGKVEEDNIVTIRRLGEVEFLGTIPFIQEFGNQPAEPSVFIDECEKKLNMKRLRGKLWPE